jgi:hypothetical protein
MPSGDFYALAQLLERHPDWTAEMFSTPMAMTVRFRARHRSGRVYGAEVTIALRTLFNQDGARFIEHLERQIVNGLEELDKNFFENEMDRLRVQHAFASSGLADLASSAPITLRTFT